jgi:hypothetical protein
MGETMTLLELKIPIDSTFLSHTIYEGILFSISSSNTNTFSAKEVYFPKDFLKKAYKSLEDERIDKITIIFTGNDKIETLLETLKISEKPKKTFRGLIKVIKNNDTRIPEPDNIKLLLKLEKKNMLIDSDRKVCLAAPQLFKVDRYTGISSFETKLISEQLGLRMSAETILLSLLGTYSSHVTTVRGQENVYHYFLFFAPEEVVSLLNNGDLGQLNVYLTMKEEIMEGLVDFLSSSIVNEFLLLEIMLNTKFLESMRKKGLDKIGLILFKVSPEGQTYKIYEIIPITLYKEPAFYDILAKKTRNADKICEILSSVLSSGETIANALKSFNTRNKFDEADEILKGVLSLYRFVVLADVQGLYDFLHYLKNACKILEAKNPNNPRIKSYLRIKRELAYFI